MESVHLIGNAHLDPVWLWSWREGLHEIKATFRSALDRMNEFEGYVFTCACASYYEWVEENAPEMFEEIRLRVKEGRWRIVGGMWVQPDMNTPSGESVARQLMMSQRYFYEKFGITVKTGYNVDTFGHNGQLPQILNLAGIVNYVWMRPMMNENALIPEGALTWEGIDGSSVRAFRIPNGYCGEDIEKRIEAALAFGEKCGVPVMCFYGVGNHGGGPTRRCLSRIDAWKKENPEKCVQHSHPDAYFEAISKKTLPVWRGELQHHASGCYSTFADSKMLHRRAENTLLSAETAGVMAQRMLGFEGKTLDRAWKKLLFNQFHDLLGGCSMRSAMDDMITDLRCVLSDAMYAENAALQKLSWAVDTSMGNPALIRSKENDWARWNTSGFGTPIVVFNPHAFEAQGEVSVFGQCTRVLDDQGNHVPVQRIRAQRTNGQDKWDTMFLAKAPALGYRVYWMYLDGDDERFLESDTLAAADTLLENRFLRVEFDEKTGEIKRLLLKETGFEAVNRPGRCELRDMEPADTWAHNIFTFDKTKEVFALESIKLIESGPARATIRVKKRVGENTLVRDFSLNAEGKEIGVTARAFMTSPHRLLKICLNVNAPDMRFVSEIPFGSIGRVPNGDEEPCQRWIAGFSKQGGAAIINTGAYSASALPGEIAMSFVNTSAFADHYGQHERDEFMEYMQMGETKFSYAIMPFAGDVSESGVWKKAAVMNEPLKWVVETYHEGVLPREYRGISVSAENVLLRAVKRSENGKGIVLRFYEAAGKGTKADIDLTLLGRSASLSFRPFEIKTLFVPDDGKEEMREIALTELSV